MRPRTSIIFAAIWVSWLFFKSHLWAIDPALLVPCGLMAFLVLFPLWQWLSGSMNSFPATEIFSLVHLPAYLIPLLEGRPDILQYPRQVLLKTAFMVCSMLLSVQICSKCVGRRVQRDGRLDWPFLRRSISGTRESGLMWFLLSGWCLFVIALYLRWLPNLGAFLNIVRTLAN